MALFGLHTPIFGPLHPIIGTLSGSLGLSGFTQWRVPYGNSTGGLTDSANFIFDGTGITLGSGTTALQDIIKINNGTAVLPKVQYESNFFGAGYAGWLWTLDAGDTAVVSKSNDGGSVLCAWSKALNKEVSAILMNTTDLSDGSGWMMTKRADTDNHFGIEFNDYGAATSVEGLTVSVTGDLGFKAGLYRNSVLWLNYNDSYPYNVYFGPLVGNTTGTGQGNSALGYNTMNVIESGQNNLGWGRNTLSALTTGNANVALGTSCLAKITTTSQNMAIGQGAMENTGTSAASNVAIGYTALRSVNTTMNVAIGNAAGYALTSGNRTVAIGGSAVDAVSTAASNTGVGYNSLTNTTGAGNTAVGNESGSVNTTGTNNTFVGNQAGFTGTTNNITNSIALGYNTQVTASNTARIGTGISAGIDCQPTLKFSVLEKSGMTDIGGFAIRLTNKTGANSVKGTLVQADTVTDSAVVLTTADSAGCIGVVYTDGVADGSEIWVVVAGIAEVKLEDNQAATRGYWVDTSPTAGRAAMSTPVPGAVVQHFEEIGHCIQSVAASATGCLAKCVLHFN